MRHAKSCSNHVRALSDDHVDLSQTIRDPGLSVHGAAAARSYGPVLRSKLAALGLDLRHAFVGSSGLRRARDTCELVTGRVPITVPHFTEHGNIPENTPTGARRHEAPQWTAFLRALRSLSPDSTAAVVVGHGSFLASQFPEMKKFHNLDGVLLVGDWTGTGTAFKIVSVRAVRHHDTSKYTSEFKSKSIGPDRCSVPAQEQYIQHKLTPYSRTMKRTMKRPMKTRRRPKQRSQRGGMPQAWYVPGAQFSGTSAYPTGQGLAITTSQMVREPLTMTGGRRRPYVGGFNPSVMGSFLQTGSAYVPAAASYAAYKLFHPPKTQKKKSRRQSKE